MNRNITFAPSEFYHLYNRGVDKRIIFANTSCYKRFTTLLYLANGTEAVRLNNQDKINRSLNDFDDGSRGESLVDIIAYCLMPNHFHILVREKSDSGISKFMHKLSTGYTMYFNKRYDRSGALFQSKFKATHANRDNYLKYLLAYIHLNPIKLIDSEWKNNGIKNMTKAEKFLNQYKYSSYLDYKSVVRTENKLLNMDTYPAYFNSIKNLEEEMKEWLEFIKVQPC